MSRHYVITLKNATEYNGEFKVVIENPEFVVDGAGNKVAEGTVTKKIDFKAPTVDAKTVKTTVDGTKHTVTMEFTFDEPVAAFEKENVKLVGKGGYDSSTTSNTGVESVKLSDDKKTVTVVFKADSNSHKANESIEVNTSKLTIKDVKDTAKSDADGNQISSDIVLTLKKIEGSVYTWEK